MSELALNPDIYEPSMDEHDNYVDKMPSKDELARGIRCSCFTSKKVFNTSSSLRTHFGTLRHKQWLDSLNKNKTSIVTEYAKSQELVASQKLIIANLEKEIIEKNVIIQFLTNLIELKPKEPIQLCQSNLIDL